ncbi:MAG TPA: heavy metal-associated domain-containing protein [Gemmataceae bacterium]|nr:heavy metal-associated domain-containing protein [Gemmataceae bacterium]
MKRLLLAILCLYLAPFASAGGDKSDAPQRVKHQITGLFSTDREADLREAFENIPDIKLVAIDFANAEATLEYVPTKVFGNVKPDEKIRKLDNLLKSASHHTFGVKPLYTMPREKLRRIAIPVAGLDCKACCLAAYEAIYRLDGVETATASFREGRVTALIDPAKTNRATLEAALKKRGVDVKSR